MPALGTLREPTGFLRGKEANYGPSHLPCQSLSEAWKSRSKVRLSLALHSEVDRAQQSPSRAQGPRARGTSGHLAWQAQAQDCSRHQASLMTLSMPVGACFPMPTQAPTWMLGSKLQSGLGV